MPKFTKQQIQQVFLDNIRTDIAWLVGKGLLVVFRKFIQEKQAQTQPEEEQEPRQDKRQGQMEEWEQKRIDFIQLINRMAEPCSAVGDNVQRMLRDISELTHYLNSLPPESLCGCVKISEILWLFKDEIGIYHLQMSRLVDSESPDQQIPAPPKNPCRTLDFSSTIEPERTARNVTRQHNQPSANSVTAPQLEQERSTTASLTQSLKIRENRARLNLLLRKEPKLQTRAEDIAELLGQTVALIPSDSPNKRKREKKSGAPELGSVVVSDTQRQDPPRKKQEPELQ